MRSLLLASVLICFALRVQADVVGVYTFYASTCNLRDTAGPRTLYVIHALNGSGGYASRFRVEFSEGMTATLTSFTSPYATLSGSPLTGVEVQYGDCVLGDHVVLELNMLFYGTSDRCSWVRAGSHPTSIDGMIDILGCGLVRRPASWEGTHVDPIDPFNCPSDGCGCHGGCCCRPYSPPVAVETTTWGQIKALYY